MNITEYQKTLVAAKYESIKKAITDNNGNKTKAAAALGIDRKTLYNVINRYELIKRVD